MWKIIAVLVCCIWSQFSAASVCSYTNWYQANISTMGWLNQISPTTPVGAVVLTLDFSSETSSTTFRTGCAITEANVRIRMLNSLSSYGNNVYNTGISGLGIRLRMYGQYVQNPAGPSVKVPISDGNYRVSNGVWEFVKTGQIGTGKLNEKVAEITMLEDSFVSYLGVYSDNPVNTKTCRVSNSGFNIKLDDLLAESLSGTGSVHNPKNMQVGLACDSGARVSAVLRGTKNTETTADGVLQLTNAGSAGVAAGVGIQILYNNTAMQLNNSITLKASAATQENLPFTVQYYQTKNTVTAGSANATATLEMTYQ